MADQLMAQMRKSNGTITIKRHMKDKLSKETSSLLLIKMIAELKGHKAMHKIKLNKHRHIVSEYDQEIPQSQTADKFMAPQGRATQQPHDTRGTNKAKQPAFSSPSI